METTYLTTWLLMMGLTGEAWLGSVAMSAMMIEGKGPWEPHYQTLQRKKHSMKKKILISLLNQKQLINTAKCISHYYNIKVADVNQILEMLLICTSLLFGKTMNKNLFEPQISPYKLWSFCEHWNLTIWIL